MYWRAINEYNYNHSYSDIVSMKEELKIAEEFSNILSLRLFEHVCSLMDTVVLTQIELIIMC